MNELRIILNQFTSGWSLRSYFSVPVFSHFSDWSKLGLPTAYHLHVWQTSPQRCCSGISNFERDSMDLKGMSAKWKYLQRRNWPLQLRNNGRDSVSNHQPHDCLLNCLFRRRSKKTSKLRVTGLYAGNSPETGEFPAQMASNAENVSIWWRHDANGGLVYPIAGLSNNITSMNRYVTNKSSRHVSCVFSSVLRSFYNFAHARIPSVVQNCEIIRYMKSTLKMNPIYSDNMRNLVPGVGIKGADKWLHMILLLIHALDSCF